MILVRVADLVGEDVTGIIADRRSRHANGELFHPGLTPLDTDPPIKVPLLAVDLKEGEMARTLQQKCGKKKGLWLHWRWRRSGKLGDCGYSGVLAEDDAHKDYYILVDRLPEGFGMKDA